MRVWDYTFVVALVLGGMALGETPKPAANKPDEKGAEAFSAAKAAEFIDGVSVAWTRERKCMTCHTNVPYMMARPTISGGDPKPLEEIRTFMETNVKNWEKNKPKNDYDVCATAFALAAHDSMTTKKLHPATKAALDRAWTVQKKDGSWAWPDCDWPPLEHDQFYGVAFMAVATAMAPDDYLKTDAAKAGLDKIRAYIKANPNKELHHRLTLAWAATKIDGLIDDDAKKAALDELKKLQRQDGGWNMPSMGPYVKNRTGKDNDINGPSDGYATGFATFILLKTGASKKEDANIQAALKWLQANQRESGRWFTASLGGSKAHYLTNVGSSFAILALHEGGVPLKAALPSE